MHDGGWLGMGGMGLYWLVPALIVLVVIVAWMASRRREEAKGSPGRASDPESR